LLIFLLALNVVSCGKDDDDAGGYCELNGARFGFRDP